MPVIYVRVPAKHEFFIEFRKFCPVRIISFLVVPDFPPTLIALTLDVRRTIPECANLLGNHCMFAVILSYWLWILFIKLAYRSLPIRKKDVKPARFQLIRLHTIL